MPILVALQALVTAAVALHIYRTGRPNYWVAIVLMFPGFGVLAYLFLEVLPGSREGAQVMQGLRALRKRIDPTRDFRARVEEVERCGSVANKVQLARECISLAYYDQAAALLRSVLSGSFKDDPQAQHLLSVALYGAEQYSAAIEQLQLLIKDHEWYASGDALLLLANAYAAAGRESEADVVFRSLVERYSGEEARSDYIGFLAQQGRFDLARQQLEEMHRRLRLNGRAYQRRQQPFVKSAESILAAGQT